MLLLDSVLRLFCCQGSLFAVLVFAWHHSFTRELEWLVVARREWQQRLQLWECTVSSITDSAACLMAAHVLYS